MDYSRGFDNQGKKDADVVIQQKHQALLNQYLNLQKDCVLKKKKLEAARKKKEALLREVRFLKARRKFLLKNQAQQIERERNQSQKSHDLAGEHNKDMKFSFPIPLLANSYPVIERASELNH